MSKKNIKTNSKTNSKAAKKPIKKITKIEDSEITESDSIDLIDDKELNELEEKIKIEKELKGEKDKIAPEIDKNKLEKVQNDTQVKKVEEGEEKPVKMIKKTKKDTVIDTILDTYEKLGIPEGERMKRHQLKAEKLNILEKKLADMASKIAGSLLVKKEIEIKDKIQDDKYNAYAVDMLFNLNVVFTSFIENMAGLATKNENIKEYIPNIEGMHLRMLKPEKEKMFKECLAAIMKEHGDVIKQYMSPVLVWASLMLSTATEQIAENKIKELSKNSQEPIKEK